MSARPPEWFCGWFAGFVEGEGSFNIATHGGRNLQPRLSVKLRDDDPQPLALLRRFLGGTVHPHRMAKGSAYYSPLARDQLVWTLVGKDCTRALTALDWCGLQGKKARDYQTWRKAVVLYTEQPHTRWTVPELRAARDHRLAELKRMLESGRRYTKQLTLIDPGAQAARVLVADPGWSFDDALPGPKRGAASHYRCMTLPEICDFPLPPLAANAWLFLWRVASMQEEALAVCNAWGFRSVAEIVWAKTAAHGGLRIGMGHYVRNAHEACIVAVRGAPKRLSASVPSVFEAARGAHSAKPDAFYALVERLAEGPYAELFARKHRPGWACFGDELEAHP